MLDLKPFKKGVDDPADWLEKFYRFFEGNYWIERLLSGQLVPKGEKSTNAGNVSVAGTLTAWEIIQRTVGAARYAQITNGTITAANDATEATASKIVLDHDASHLGSEISLLSDAGTSLLIGNYDTTSFGLQVLYDAYGNPVSSNTVVAVYGAGTKLSLGASGLCAMIINDDATVTLQPRGIPSVTTNKIWVTSGALYYSGGQVATLDGSTKLPGAQQTYGSATDTACVGNDSRLGLSVTPEAVTATSGGNAASVTVANTEITTDGDSDEDNVTLTAGTVGQLKHIYCKAVGNAADSFKVTPATMVGGTKVSFAANPIGKGCTLVYTSSGWICIGTQGGVVS